MKELEEFIVKEMANSAMGWTHLLTLSGIVIIIMVIIHDLIYKKSFFCKHAYRNSIGYKLIKFVIGFFSIMFFVSLVFTFLWDVKFLETFSCHFWQI